MDWILDALRDAGLEGIADNLVSVILHATNRGQGRTLTDSDCRIIIELLNTVQNLRNMARTKGNA